MTVGRIYRDGKGAGRVYIPKKLMEQLNFESGEQVLIRAEENKLEILKLEVV